MEENTPMVEEQEQVVEHPVEEQETEQQQGDPEQQVESKEDRDYRALRRAKAQAERERDELLRQMQMASNNQSRQPEPEESSLGIGDDDLIEGKHYKQLDKNVRALQKKLQEQEASSKNMAAEARLKSMYPDFDKVVSKDNIDILRETYPEIAQTLSSSQDLYSAGVSAYSFIKNLGLGKEDLYEQDRNRAKSNSAKPRPLASVSPQQGDSPLSHANAFANGLTNELKQKLYKEMLELSEKN